MFFPRMAQMIADSEQIFNHPSLRLRMAWPLMSTPSLKAFAVVEAMADKTKAGTNRLLKNCCRPSLRRQQFFSSLLISASIRDIRGKI